jgi:diamine N-acetyltransferase
MSERFILRSATLADYDGMCALLGEVDALHRLNVPWMFREPSAEPRTKEFFGQLHHSKDAAVSIADAAGHLVGIAIALLKTPPDSPLFITQTWGLLDSIAVSSSWRRRGVGTALLRHAERWVQGRGGKWLELGVYDFNDDALSFYRALGYAPVSTKLRKALNDAG